MQVNDDPAAGDEAAGQLAGAMKAIAQDVSGKAAAARAGISAAFAVRIQAAIKGAPREMVGAIIRGIMAEQQAAMRAASEAAGIELVGRMAGAMNDYRGKRRRPGGKKKPPRGPRH